MLALPNVAIVATMVGRWHVIVMVRVLCSVIFLVDWVILNFHLNAAGSTPYDASMRESLRWNQGITTMDAMVYIRMGGTIVPWFG